MPAAAAAPNDVTHFYPAYDRMLLDIEMGKSDDALAVAKDYLRDNIRYVLGAGELDGLRTFYRYAAEADLVAAGAELRLYQTGQA